MTETKIRCPSCDSKVRDYDTCWICGQRLHRDANPTVRQILEERAEFTCPDCEKDGLRLPAKISTHILSETKIKCLCGWEVDVREEDLDNTLPDLV